MLKASNGQGVDLVLNSLTGHGFIETSLSCTAKGGRFVEMSKLNILNNDEVSKLRSDVEYSIEDVTILPVEYRMKLFQVRPIPCKTTLGIGK